MGQLFAELAARKVMKPGQEMIAVFLDDPDLVPIDELRSRAGSLVGEDVDLALPLQKTTTLVETFRAHFPDAFTYEKTEPFC